MKITGAKENVTKLIVIKKLVVFYYLLMKTDTGWAFFIECHLWTLLETGVIASIWKTEFVSSNNCPTQFSNPPFQSSIATQWLTPSSPHNYQNSQILSDLQGASSNIKLIISSSLLLYIWFAWLIVIVNMLPQPVSLDSH